MREKTINEDEELDAAWSAFVKRIGNKRTNSNEGLTAFWRRCLEERRTITDEQWEWIRHVMELPSTRELNGFDSVCVQLDVGDSDEFWLKLTRREDFPREAPRVDCTFRAGFKFHWQETSRLRDVLDEYRTFVERVQETLEHVRSLNTRQLHLESYDLDETNPGLMRVQLVVDSDDDREAEGEKLRAVMFLSLDAPLLCPAKMFVEPADEGEMFDMADVWIDGDELLENVKRALFGE